MEGETETEMCPPPPPQAGCSVQGSACACPLDPGTLTEAGFHAVLPGEADVPQGLKMFLSQKEARRFQESCRLWLSERLCL